MRWYLYLIAIFLIPCALAGPINITAVSSGCDYIQWNWTPGLDVDEIYIDGTAICGYETTSNTTLITGFHPGEIHRIDIIDGVDTGYNITETSSLLACAVASGGGGGTDMTAPFLLIGIATGLILTIAYIRRES
jgi:hypothetical protein